VGLTETLELEIHPENATNKDFNWSSSDPSIAEVDPNGIVKGISPGEASITVTSGDNNFTATTTVHIIRWTYYPMNDVPVRPVVIDLQDNVWCGGLQLTKFIGNAKYVYPSIINISAIASNNSENIWLGTYNLGIWKFDGDSWTNYTSSNSNLAYNSINYNSMALDHKGNLWMGTAGEAGIGSGVTMFDGSEWHVFNSDNGLPSNAVLDIAIDHEGIKWFTTRNGISRFDDVNWVSYASAAGINFTDRFFSVAIDHENNKWFGSYGGPAKFDGNNWTFYNSSNSDLKWDSINDIAVDQDNNVWFATESGVSKFDGTNWINYTSVKEMQDKVYNVRAIAIDSRGDKWLGTSFGVIKLED